MNVTEAMKLRIESENSEHQTFRNHLMQESFPPPDRTRAAHYLREYCPPDHRYSFVALADRDKHLQLIGSIRFTPVILPNKDHCLMLGPLAVDPKLRGLGIGQKLIQKALDALKNDHEKALLVIGDAGYFAHEHFSVNPVSKLSLPGKVDPLVFMGIEWKENYLHRLSGKIERITRETEKQITRENQPKEAL